MLRGLIDQWMVHYKLRKCTSVGSSPKVVGRVWIHGKGTIRLGSGVFLDGAVAPIELHAGPGAVLSIGDDVYIGGGSSIEAQQSVTIGARTQVGKFCKLLDNNFHPLTGDRTQRPTSSPIVIEADAQLGPRVILLPGAHIGSAAQIGAGTVITRLVPAGAVAKGHPPVIRTREAQ